MLVYFCVSDQQTIMTKLSLFAACIGAALLCTAMPASLNLSRAGMTLFSLDTAEAKVGRPLTPGSVAGVNRRAHRRAAATAGAVAAGTYVAAPAAAGAYGPGPVVGPGYVKAPYAGPGYYVEPVVVDPVTGRRCRIEADGYRFCWIP